MPLVLSVHEIRPDRLDAWRELMAELAGPRRVELAESHRRRGIRRAVMSLAGTADRPLHVALIDVDDAGAKDMLDASTEAFDVWMREQFAELLGEELPGEVVFDTAPRRGPWRGLRRPSSSS